MLNVNHDLNEILIRRKNKIFIQSSDFIIDSTNKIELIATFIAELEHLGYIIDKEIYEELTKATTEEVIKVSKTIIDILKEVTGADHTYKPMYPNFPKQVMEASEVELFINAIFHYWSNGEWMPQYAIIEREALKTSKNLTILSLADKTELDTLLNNLLQSKSSLSEQDKKDVKTIIKNMFAIVVPREIPYKENAMFFSKVWYEHCKEVDCIKHLFKTATDVLRFAATLSNGDVSLAQTCRFRKFSRPERRMLMDLLVYCENSHLDEDMFRYRNQWLRLGEIIHPFTFKNPKYAKVNKAFNMLRNEKKPLYFAGQVQKAIEKGYTMEAASLLTARPGEFARLLDALIRKTEKVSDQLKICDAFSSVAEEVPIETLLQLSKHFTSRTSEDSNDYRLFFPKGITSKLYVRANNLEPISPIISSTLLIICNKAILKQLSKKESLGKVYIDEDFKNYLMPTNQRAASSATKIITKGSRLPIEKNTNIIRSFIWWTNTEKYRIDIDLSVAIYSDAWEPLTHVSYTKPRNGKMNIYHSGDITNGGPVDGEGAAEFIDLDINAITEHDGRYAVFEVFNYSNENFSELPHCHFGWQNRAEIDSGEIFEPSTVENLIKLNCESTVVIPVIFDCVEKCFIWCDTTLDNKKIAMPNCVETHLTTTSLLCQHLANMFKTKPSLYELCLDNAFARGQVVTNIEEADLVFSNDSSLLLAENAKQITSYDLEYFMSELL